LRLWAVPTIFAAVVTYSDSLDYNTNPYDDYFVDIEAGSSVHIIMICDSADGVDSYVQVFAPGSVIPDFEADGNPGNSFDCPDLGSIALADNVDFSFVAPVTGTYQIRATTYNYINGFDNSFGTGTYRLTIDGVDLTNPPSLSPPGPGRDMVYIPPQAVVGSFLDWTPLYYLPHPDASSNYEMGPGQSLWVFGVDASGQFYQVLLSGDLYWVPVDKMGPNYDDVWNGTPLPTNVVE
jgi:hypothetical protein